MTGGEPLIRHRVTHSPGGSTITLPRCSGIAVAIRTMAMQTESTTHHVSGHRPSPDRSRSIRLKDVLPLIWTLRPTAIITYLVSGIRTAKR